ncbi:MAG: hypothetical protein R3323_10250, partial [Wenzhouxiangellaceae bacterium]|nr:hypothetical protein [Wenzhouxiangellaceae bacterium]
MALKGSKPRTPVHRSDHRPPDWFIDDVDLVLDLDPGRTRVRARLDVRRNPEAAPDAPLVLDGVGLETLAVTVDGAPVD